MTPWRSHWLKTYQNSQISLKIPLIIQASLVTTILLEPGGGVGLSLSFLSDNLHRSFGASSFLRVLSDGETVTRWFLP